MKDQSLRKKAKEIARRFLQIVEEDETLDREYEDAQRQVTQGRDRAVARLQAEQDRAVAAIEKQRMDAQQDINDIYAVLSAEEAKLPAKLAAGASPRKVTAAPPNFNKLQELLTRINDPRFAASVMRTVGIGGYRSKKEMASRFLEIIEGGRLYLQEEERRNHDAAMVGESVARQQFLRERTAEEQKAAAAQAENRRLYEEAAADLTEKLQQTLSSAELPAFEAELAERLKEVDGYEEAFEEFAFAEHTAEELMIGAVGQPLPLPAAAAAAVAAKLPISYAEGMLWLPAVIAMDQPLQLTVHYDDASKETVMEGIQSILLKWLKRMPQNSYQLTYIDPNDRGTNLGLLQKLCGITAFPCCKICASKRDISDRLKELERFVDETSRSLAGVESVYRCDPNGGEFPRQLLIFNDYPINLERDAFDSLEVLVNNAQKCGISMIFVQQSDVTLLPGKVQREFPLVEYRRGKGSVSLNKNKCGFAFDDLPYGYSAFLDKVIVAFQQGVQVDNRFGSHFSGKATGFTKDSTYGLAIPFAIDGRGKVVTLELGGPLTAHGLAAGATGSGKSTLLHMLITAVLLHYHPDDVELWLVDYAKVEFAEYTENTPPHIRFIGLEQGREFTFGLLHKVDAECRRRMELFRQAGVSSITEYKEKFGAKSLSRIILIIDEFHQLTQAIQDEPEQMTILENILSEYRKFGLTCLFSDQSVVEGLRGLTEKGRKQIGVRLGMKMSEPAELRETLALDHSQYDDALTAKMNTMEEGDVILKRNEKDPAGGLQVEIDRYKTVYITKAERAEVIASLHRMGLPKRELTLVDGKQRRLCDPKGILLTEQQNGPPTQAKLPIYLGTPAGLERCFFFRLENRLDHNIMTVGADLEQRASVLFYTISSFSRLENTRTVLFADPEDELFMAYRSQLAAFDRLEIFTDIADICKEVSALSAGLQAGVRQKTLVLWLGAEVIGSEMSLLPERDGTPGGADDLFGEIDRMLEEFDQPTEETGLSESYDARSDIKALVTRGPRFGLHHFVTLSSVKLLRQCRFLEPESFGHKIAFAMSRDDWYDFFSHRSYPADLDAMSAVYDDGSVSHRFRPYLLQ